ncbi:hypothetical protein HZS_2810 [Henneguya salminicola]|nr:hypothetical protein HZS_2810 [Henneguya salminicola]
MEDIITKTESFFNKTIYATKHYKLFRSNIKEAFYLFPNNLEKKRIEMMIPLEGYFIVCHGSLSSRTKEFYLNL